jgi:hypothetical protein
MSMIKKKQQKSCYKKIKSSKLIAQERRKTNKKNFFKENKIKDNKKFNYNNNMCSVCGDFNKCDCTYCSGCHNYDCCIGQCGDTNCIVCGTPNYINDILCKTHHNQYNILVFEMSDELKKMPVDLVNIISSYIFKTPEILIEGIQYNRYITDWDNRYITDWDNNYIDMFRFNEHKY